MRGSYLQRSLVRGEGNETAAIGRELSEEAGGLLHVDHSEVWEKVLVEAPYSVPVSSGSARTDPAPLEAMNYVLILYPPGLQGRRVFVHRCDRRTISNACSEGGETGGQNGDKLHHSAGLLPRFSIETERGDRGVKLLSFQVKQVRAYREMRI